MRKTKLNSDVQKRICDALRAGNTRHDSAVYAGIHESTFYDWINKGNAAKSGLYSEFSEAVKKAESEAVVRSVALIQKAAQDSWQAAAWFLERRRPGDWGKREKLELSGSIDVKVIDFSDAD